MALELKKLLLREKEMITKNVTLSNAGVGR